MAIGIYKKGQGYWTRLMSAIAYGLVVLMGVVWLWKLLEPVKVAGVQTVYVQASAAVLVIAVFGWFGFYLIGLKPRVVDFMIATEGEMKKVNWSTRKEILGSTWVVIGLTVFVAVFCLLCDLTFKVLFTFLKVLKA